MDKMGKEDNSNFIKKIFLNVYIRNIVLMAIIAGALIAATLFILKIYTKHNHSVEVPDLKGMQVQDASAIVKSNKLRYEVVDSIYQEGGTPGAILEQIPKGSSQVKEGRTIYLTIQSISEPLIAVPDLEDASLRQSETLLNTLGFTNINIIYIPSEYEGLVYAVEYKGIALKAGQKIPKGAALTLKVGDGGQYGLTNDSLNSTIDNTEDEIQ